MALPIDAKLVKFRLENGSVLWLVWLSFLIAIDLSSYYQLIVDFMQRLGSRTNSTEGRLISLMGAGCILF
jgi:hypothetical protein